MPTPNELDAIFAQNLPLGMAPEYGGYRPTPEPDMNTPVVLGGASRNLDKTPEQEAERARYFNTPSYAATMQPQLQGGKQEETTRGDSGWRDLFAGIADAGASLQGRQGNALSMLAQQRQNQQEMQAKMEQAKEAKQQKRFEFMVKANESPDPDVRKRMMKAALQAGVITEQDEAVLSKVPSGKLKMWAPRLQKESPRIWDSYRNGELPDAIVNEIIKQQESRDAEEYAMQRIPELENERDSGSISPTNRAMLDFFEKTYGPQLLKVQQEREALAKAQRENRIGAATEQLDIGTAREGAERAIIKTQQDRLDIQLKKAQIASVEQARIGANDPSYQMYRNDLHDIEGAFGLKVPLLDAAGNFNPQALSGGGVDMKGLHRAIDRYIADKKKPDSVREYMRQFKTAILEPEENAVKRDTDSATKELGSAFPPAMWKGKRKLDSKTGVTYESDGNTWKPVK